MNPYSRNESNWNPSRKHALPSNGEYSSATKRSRPTLSERLGIVDDSDPSDDEPYSPSDNNSFETQQRIIRQPQASLRESTLISSGQPSKAILELLKDDDEDEEEIEDEAYSPSQLDPATMDEVSHQLKESKEPSASTASTVGQPATYVPPSSFNIHQQDVDYRERKKTRCLWVSKTDEQYGSSLSEICDHCVVSAVKHLRIVSQCLEHTVQTAVRFPDSKCSLHLFTATSVTNEKAASVSYQAPSQETRFHFEVSCVGREGQHIYERNPELDGDAHETESSATSNDTATKHELNQGSCRVIPVHSECTGIDPRLRIHSARLRSKVRQLVLERLPANDSVDRNEILEELDHLVESHGRRLYWYRVICFLQNISLTNNTPKQIHYYLKEVSKLLVLTPSISKVLKIKQKYPKAIPIHSTETQSVVDPRSKARALKSAQLKPLRYQ